MMDTLIRTADPWWSNDVNSFFADKKTESQGGHVTFARSQEVGFKSQNLMCVFK